MDTDDRAGCKVQEGMHEPLAKGDLYVVTEKFFNVWNGPFALGYPSSVKPGGLLLVADHDDPNEEWIKVLHSRGLGFVTKGALRNLCSRVS